MLSLGSNPVVIERHPTNGAVSLKRPRPSGIQKTPVLSTAELAECNCPEFCERDHDLD